MTPVPNRPSKAIQKTIHIDYKSYVNDYHYIGDFVAKKLTIRDLSALGVRKAQLNGGMHYSDSNPGQGVDAFTDETNGMIAHLELAIVTAPPWWKLDEILDTDLLMKVYKEVLDFENSFLRKHLERIAAKNLLSEAGSEGQNTESNAPRAAGDVVQKDLQAALDP